MPYVRFDRRKTSVLTTTDFFQSSAIEDRIVCLSARDVTVIRAFIYPHSIWNTRFGSWASLDDFLVASADEHKQLIDHIGKLEWKLGGYDMGCGADIKEGLQAIADALAGLQIVQSNTQTVTCGGDNITVPINNYVQGVTENGEIIYGTKPGDNGTGLEGLTPEELAKRCQAANAIVDGLIASMDGLAVLDIALLVELGASAGVVGLAIAAGVVVNPVILPALIVAMVGLGVSLGVLKDIASEWRNNRDSFVCDLYNSDNIASATEVVGQYIDEAIAAVVVSSAFHPAIRTIALVLANSDTLNQLFDGTASVLYPDADCSGCEEEPEVLYAIFPPAANYEGDNRFDSTSDGGVNHVNVAAFYDNGAFYGEPAVLVDVDIIGEPGPLTEMTWEIQRRDSSYIYQGVLPAGQKPDIFPCEDIGYFHVYSAGSFDLVFDWDM